MPWARGWLEPEGGWCWLYHGRAAVGCRRCRTHLGRDVQAGVDARTGQTAVHLVVTHHGKRGGVGASDGQGGPQGGGCYTESERG